MAFNQYWEDVGEYGAYGLPSLAQKIRMSNHLEMLQQRQHILLSYFETPRLLQSWAWTLSYLHSKNTFAM